MVGLEIDSSSKLDDSWSTRCRRLTKQRTVDVVARQTEVDGVEDVEEVRAKRESHILRDGNSLDNREVSLVECRTVELVSSYCAQATNSWASGRTAGRCCYVHTVGRTRILEQASVWTSVGSWVVGCSCEIR